MVFKAVFPSGKQKIASEDSKSGNVSFDESLEIDTRSSEVDIDKLVNFAFNVSKLLQSATVDDIIYFNNVETKAVFHEFSANPMACTVFIVKVDAKETSSPEEDNEGLGKYVVLNQLTPIRDTVSTIVMIKEKGELVNNVSLDLQIQVLVLPRYVFTGSGKESDRTTYDRKSYEMLKTLVSMGIFPYFEALTQLHNNTVLGDDADYKIEEENKSAIIVTKKKFNELSLSLQHILHSVQAPDILSTVHPVIRSAVEQAGSQDPVDIISKDVVNDSVFLNQLQSIVNEWVKSVQDISRLGKDTVEGEVSHEINFWSSIEIALVSVQDQLKSKEVETTLNVLRKAKRFYATMSLLSDTGLKEALTTANQYNQLLKDLPIDELLSASSFKKVEESIVLIMNHMKKLRVTSYPIGRALKLVESISLDLDFKMKYLIRQANLMELSFEEFVTQKEEINCVFITFEKQIKEFINLARELLRKRSEKFIFVKINSKTVNLQNKLETVSNFRRKHDEMIIALKNIFSADIMPDHPINDMEYAYEAVSGLDIADTSHEGKKKWDIAEKMYNTRIQKVEKNIISKLKEVVQKAKTINEMFYIFNKYHFLLSKPSINTFIQEYQNKLLEIAVKSIKNLQLHFLKQSQSRILYQRKDVQTVSITIIWAKQIENKLNNLLDRLNGILGPNWYEYSNGQKIYSEAMVFKKKLNVTSLYESILHEISSKNIYEIINENIFRLSKQQDSSIMLEINFDMKWLVIFKEIRNLCYLDYQLPHHILSICRTIRKIYPFVVNLNEILSMLRSILHEQLEDFNVLLKDEKVQLYGTISQCFHIKWDELTKEFEMKKQEIFHTKSLNLIGKLETSVQNLQAKTQFLQETKLKLGNYLLKLTSCLFESDVFADILTEIQTTINTIILANYNNVNLLVSKINDKIQKIFVERLKTRLLSINHQNLDLPVSHHEIILENFTILAKPQLETSKFLWITHVKAQVDIVKSQKKITYENFDAKLDSSKETWFSHIDLSVQNELKLLFNSIESHFQSGVQYFRNWQQFQSLWDLQTENVYSYLKNDLELWIDLLDDIKQSRKIFDTMETSKQIGCILFDYEQIQVRINAKYDIWQKQLVSKFSEILSNSMKELYSDIITAKTYLENNIINISSMENTIQLITNLHKYKILAGDSAKKLAIFQNGQNILVRNRFPLPLDWLHVEQMENDLIALEKILRLRLDQIDVDVIKKKIEGESNKMLTLISDLKQSWSMKKPLSGTLVPSDALNILKTFEKQTTDIDKRKSLIQQAIDVLGLPITVVGDLAVLKEEILDFKSVWNSIDILYTSLEDIKQTLWTDIVIRNIRKQLDNLLIMSKTMPTKVRQYSAFQHLQSNIKSLLKENTVLSELKSDAMKERHWKLLYKVLSKDFVSLHLLTLGDVWDLNLALNTAQIKEVINQANGEKVLETSLEKIKDKWNNNIVLDLFMYQNKFRLIKGWNLLFKHCNEDIDELSTMKHSVYYSVFEQEAAIWESKLNKLYVLLDVWIDVQRQWVYLDGVFGENKDIKRLLPVESTRFQNISMEFSRLLKNVYKSPFVIKTIDIEDIQPSMEKTLEILSRIRKSLGDYLEKQREFFPRFYFIGNDDLLNIIGNSNDPKYIGTYLDKIYANIHGIEYVDGKITCIYSKEHESIQLAHSIDVSKYSSLIDWLKDLEYEVKQTLAVLVEEATAKFVKIVESGLNLDSLMDWLQSYPGQVNLLAIQICWTQIVEDAIEKDDFKELIQNYKIVLSLMSSAAIGNLNLVERRKIELVIIEFVHQYNVILQLEGANDKNFIWKLKIKYYLNVSSDHFEKLTIKILDSSYHYGFEYLGLTPSLVKNKVIENLFVDYNETLASRKGGCSFGPAGTGKTESVKEFGKILGRPVLVFNCDESFDFTAIGRILLGICQVGAFVCFDEFNRLDTSMLSAVSTQIEQIELGLSQNEDTIQLLGNSTKLSPYTSIFITMNPTYEGRSSLPENLKKLFRSFSVNKTDKEVIAEVLLYSQGFNDAKDVSQRVVCLFSKLEQALSKQAHYDFGLRALKSTITYCGKMRRENLVNDQKHVLYQGIYSSISPKLVQEDLDKFIVILQDIFEGDLSIESNNDLLLHIEDVAAEQGISATPGFVQKVLQLSELSSNHHGLMIVGEPGCGKSTAVSVLLKSLQRLDGIESVTYNINPKVPKELLYGSLDLTTREFKDGLFTSLLRRIVANLRGELAKRIWIVFDGDVDPEWIENLNSLLDDNKIFTLPNGEHIALPSNVKIVFETHSLKHATPATVSRCGMIWFANDLVGIEQIMLFLVHNFKQNDGVGFVNYTFVKTVSKLMEGNLLKRVIQLAMSLNHIFDFILKEKLDMMMTIYTCFHKKLAQVDVNALDEDMVAQYSDKALLLSIFWSFSGDCPTDEQETFNKLLLNLFSKEKVSLINQTISISEMGWTNWSSLVPIAEDTFAINEQLIIPTVDTVRLECFINMFLEQNKFLILCGPPGSGKTMTVLNCLRHSNRELVSINFSSKSAIEDVLSTLHQYCVYTRNNNGVVLRPKSNKEVVCFIDEINLPALDKFGSQPVIMFLRELISQGGFYSEENVFVKLENIKFVAACNPSGDQGRNELSTRLLRLCPTLFVDYPNQESLKAIYNTFASLLFISQKNLAGFKAIIIDSLINMYYQFKQKVDVVSPRDLTRFMRSLYYGLENNENMTLNEFLRLYVNETLRLFSDRMDTSQSKDWIFSILKETIVEYFPNCNETYVFKQPIIYSSWLSNSYSPVDLDQFRMFVDERLKIFSNEVLDTNLILYQDCLDHIARMNRVLSLPQGHLILVGKSTSGKTTLCRFVAWINGLLVVQLQVHRNYGLADFDSTLRHLLKRSGAYGEKICFIIDESNILETSFIERMNTLLANSEVPSLFNGNEFNDLMDICMDQSQKQGCLLDSEDELYKWFTQQISENLHVIFTISDESPKTLSSGPEILTSPALLNRCVVNWMGDWSNDTLYQVASESISSIPLQDKDFAIQALILIHRLSKAGPGDFMSFLHQFSKIYSEKEIELENHQRHINVGLDKLRDTVLQVKDLKDELSIKQQELKAKDIEAKAMLDKMLVDQNEAERKQEASKEVQNALKLQEVEINQRKAVVNENLESMIPIIEAAAQNVKNIKKQNLSELRSMNNPPEAVKLTLEAVCTLLGFGTKATWREIQSVTRRDDFILSILNFENNISQPLRDHLEKEYFSRPNFNLATVSRASKACGPLLAWIEAQVKYAAVLEQVDPLRMEVVGLEESARENKAKLYAINQMLEELQESIEQYKEGYSTLIRETENIKTKMQSVEKKVERSLALMGSLTEERNRWSKVSFKTDRSHLPGNCILSAAFLSYSGYHDQKSRMYMTKLWKELLNDKDIIYDRNVSPKDFLSTPNEILQWQENGLLNDDLFTENMILAKYSDRPLYLIDPSGQIIEVLSNILAPRKIIVTSFLDEGFVKQVENALRFGSMIIIEDAEYFDPIISNVLKQEFSNIGGRLLLKLGGQEIDCSPDFKLYLHTRNPQVQIPSFIAGRATVINFSTTKSSLESKVLNLTLLNKESDVEEKRQNLIKLNGEYRVHLRELEDSLLVSLSSTRGNILSNDELIGTLERIKSESREIEEKMTETNDIMVTVETILDKYQNLASHSSGLFSILHSLCSINQLYQFSLTFFLDIFNHVLALSSGEKSISSLIKLLYKETFSRTTPRLKEEDKLVLACCMYTNSLRANFGEDVYYSATRLLESVHNKSLDTSTVLSECLSLLGINKDKSDEFLNNFAVEALHENSFTEKPQINQLSPLIKLIMQTTSAPEKFLTSLVGFFNNTLGLEISSDNDNLKNVFSNYTTSEIPIILSSSEGFDPSFKIENLAESLNVKLSVIAMGSQEATNIANLEIKKATQEGYWVLVQNAQMAPSWLEYLSKQISGLTSSKKFRLILTTSLASAVPTTLLRHSYTLVFEKPPGLKSALSEAINSLSESRMAKLPVERRHVYFLLSWYHAVIQERARLVPVGWKSYHDFNNVDFEFALDIVDRVIDGVAKERVNISPDNIPWKELQYLIGDLSYGGKIDNETDLLELKKLTVATFNVKAFDSNYNLIGNTITTDDSKALRPPENRTIGAYRLWVKNLPDFQPSSWIGLKDDVESIVNITKGEKLAKTVSAIADKLDQF